jgi:ubiquinone/menaquinone biosynthesis C-methylase UbiE
MTETVDVRNKSSEHFGKAGSSCSLESFPPYLRRALFLIDDEILEKFYGCGSPIPPAIEGCTVLNLGCGAGRDVYLASQLVGPEGYVIGVDMTEAQFEACLTAQLTDPDCFVVEVDKSADQLGVARRHVNSHMERFGYRKPNVDFRQGYFEDLAAFGIADNSIDLVISNYCLNLVPDKERVFAEIFRVLKPGGELYFGNVFSGRRLPEELRKDPVLYGECYGGAFYLGDFGRMLRRLGCFNYRVISKARLFPRNPESAAKVREIDFYSMSIRLFKLADLEDTREDYGQTAVYLGTIPEMPHHFALDAEHLFVTGQPLPVCGNTSVILQKSRLSSHFRVVGDRSVHAGPFVPPPAAAQSGRCEPLSVGLAEGVMAASHGAEGCALPR